MATKNHNPVTHTYYYLRVERWVWAQFKSICAKKGKNMRSVLVDCLKAYVDANKGGA